MEIKKHGETNGHHKLSTIFIAAIFIIVGFMLLGKNLGWIDPYIFSIIISWQMLLIVLGVNSLCKRNFTAGIVLITLGGFFLVPVITDIEKDWFRTYWPVIFIIVGIVLLFKRHKKNSKEWVWKKRENITVGEGTSEDGFVNIDISFGGTKHIVLDPVFRGADIDISFGSVALDLRKTSLQEPQTYIDVDSSFGGVELFVPSHWNVMIEADSTLSGCDDKRRLAEEIDYEHKLIIRGDITFSGVEIKS